MRARLAFSICAFLSTSLVGCGDDGVTPGRDGGPVPDGGGTGNPGDNPTVQYDETYTGTCLGTLTCGGGEISTACACTPMASPEAANRVGCGELRMDGDMPRTAELDYCDEGAAGGAPNVGCMMPGSFRPRGTVEMVTLYGIVDVFGNGGDAEGIVVEVYEEGADGQLGAMLGSATSSIASTCAEVEDEIDNDMVIGTRDLGFYAIPNIPTETPLIVKTSGASDFWRDLYTYNFQILQEEVESGTAGDECGDAPGGLRHRYRARTLSRSDYNSIPLTAGLSTGIRSGNGAIAGEIHDCDDVRLELAQVGVSPAPRVLTFFNDNPSNPLPEVTRTNGTSVLGLYSGLDIPPGPVDVTAIATVGGQTISLGWYRARIHANSVTAVTLRGLRWQQTGE